MQTITINITSDQPEGLDYTAIWMALSLRNQGHQVDLKLEAEDIESARLTPPLFPDGVQFVVDTGLVGENPTEAQVEISPFKVGMMALRHAYDVDVNPAMYGGGS